MKILKKMPTQAEFKDYYYMLRNFHAREYADRIFSERPTNEVTLGRLIRSGLEKKKSVFKSRNTHAVETWLEAQATFEIAEIRAFRSNRPDNIDRDALIKKITDRTINLIEKDNKIQRHEFEDEKNSVLYRSLNRIFGIHPVAEWRISVVSGLFEYHFTEDALEISKMHKLLPLLLAETRRSVTQLQNLSHSNACHFDDMVNFSKLERAVKRGTERLIEVLDKDFPAGIENSYPIKRNDKTSKERLFVYRMFLAHMKHFRSPRSDAISLLLDLDGFKSPLEARQVEKLCASFRLGHKKPVVIR